MVDTLEARVVICDPKSRVIRDVINILHSRFGNPFCQEYSLDIFISTLNRYGSNTLNGVEYCLTQSLEESLKLITSQPQPHFSLVVYEADQIKPEGSAGKIADIHQHDPFLPQVVIGQNISPAIAAQCGRAGAQYIADNYSDSYTQIRKLLKRPSKIPNLVVVKLGGSAIDFDQYSSTKTNYQHVCRVFSRIHQDRFDHMHRRRVNRMIVVAGAGPRGDRPKHRLIKYHDTPKVKEHHPIAMASAIHANLEELRTHFDFSQQYGRPALLTTSAFYYIDKYSCSRRIPLIGTAPHYVMVRDSIPLEDSDTNTMALADFHSSERVVLIKRTDGIYDFDPYKGYPIGVPFKEEDYEKVIDTWKHAQRNNKRRQTVNVVDFLRGDIAREGTDMFGNPDGSDGHLMETSALHYFLEKCRHVKEICVVHIAPEEMYCPIGGDRYQHVIVPDDVLDLSNKTWEQYLEDTLTAAILRGECKSKIVKN